MNHKPSVKLEDGMEVDHGDGRQMQYQLEYRLVSADGSSSETGDYRIGILLQSGTFLEIYDLGYHFKDFAGKLTGVLIGVCNT